MDYVKYALTGAMISALSASALAQTDPGVRGGAPGAGGFIDGLDRQSTAAAQDGKARFQEVDGVPDGLGPRFNADSCVACHSQPNVGGSSPPNNPLKAIAKANGATNTIPSFITDNGPVREARYISDGGVHALGKKILEEAGEVWLAAEHESDAALAEEISQLLYWTQVLMLKRGLSLDDVYRNL